MEKEKMRNKVRGSVLAGAAGDALGYPVEFDGSFEQICARFGKNGITDYDLTIPWIGATETEAQVSDDTQMLVYTAEALMLAHKYGRPVIPVVTDAYLRWMSFQNGFQVKSEYEYRIAAIPDLNFRRAPGCTCLSALANISCGVESRNDSKGCGGIMRIAPVGLYDAVKGNSREHTALLAGEVAEITHHHLLSTLSSAMLALIVRDCVLEDKVDAGLFREISYRALETVESVYGAETRHMKFMRHIVDTVFRLVSDSGPDWKIIEEELGGGWVAEETLAISLFCVARHIDSVRDCLVAAVNHGGDSDSTGAVAGNIIGAILGYDAIPCQFTDKLQRVSFLCEIADGISDS